MYVGMHVLVESNKRRKHHHRNKHSSLKRRKRKKQDPSEDSSNDSKTEIKESVISPSQKVEFILGRADSNEFLSDYGHETPKLFTEMEELQVESGGNVFWKETGRWVKFEETVEDGGDRWSKPHVATLSLQSIYDLQNLLSKACIKLNWEAYNFNDLMDKILDLFLEEGHLPGNSDVISKVKSALLSSHTHQGEKRKKESMNNVLGLSTSCSSKKLLKRNAGSTDGSKKTFMKKIPSGSEASNILIGEQDFLQRPIAAFIRLREGIIFDGLTEVPIPTRFLFILLGPPGKKQHYHEIGRSIATLMSDEVFHEVAYKAQNREDLLVGIDEFLQQVTVLPPGEWDKSIRIEPPQSIPANQKKRLTENPYSFGKEEKLPHSLPGPELKRTGRLFGGLIEDIKRKSPFYLSDFKEAMNIQCVASFIFLYFAVLTPIVTFGGLLNDATHGYLGTMESLLGGCIAGIAFHLFSGQPLTIIGSTGPILVFEKIMFELCGSLDIDYISFRFWVGTWTGIACILLVAFDASSLICYVTRFTEESFSALISLIFIFEAFKKLLLEAKKHKIWKGWDAEKVTIYDCSCQPPDLSLFNVTNSTNSEMIDIAKKEIAKLKKHVDIGKIFKLNNSSYSCVYENEVKSDISIINWPTNLTKTDCIGKTCGVLVGDSCDYSPDIVLMSVILFFGTYFIAVSLKSLKTSRFFTNKIRSLISDFAVTISIIIMVVVDIIIGINTSKLHVPGSLEPTRKDRGWFINPLGKNQWWTILLAIVPALLATILIFMDQQITAVIVNRKENKLRKSCGYHLDLLVVSIMLIFCSMMGLPWFVAATVLSITHVNSLRMESETAAPGERPQFLGVREQRVTGVLIFVLIGLSVFLTPLLAKIPMPVLYGVFLYMGASSLKGVQFIDRLLLFLMPPKHQPDYSYLRHVPLKKVFVFTALQLIGLILLWIIKSTKPVSIVFPMMVAALVGIRKLFDYGLFTQYDLMWLDDVMPEFSRKKKKSKKQKLMMESDHDSFNDYKSSTGTVDKKDIQNGINLINNEGRTVFKIEDETAV